MLIRQFICAAGFCALIAPAADAPTVSVPEKSQPESITGDRAHSMPLPK
jgi:hypothetical protein